MHRAALADQFDQSLIHRSSSAGQLSVRPTPATSAYLQAKTIIQDFTHFAVGDPQTMLEICRQGFGSRPHYHLPCRSRGVRILILVPRSHSLLAMPAIPTVGQIPYNDWLDFRKINLKLLVWLPLAQSCRRIPASRAVRVTFVSLTSFRLGLARWTKRPCPALRPGRLGCSTQCRRANGAACRFPARFSSSTSVCNNCTCFSNFPIVTRA